MKMLTMQVTAVIGLLFAGAASAADIRMPVKAPPPAPPPPAYNWTGCYVGGGGGYGMFDQNVHPVVTGREETPGFLSNDNGGRGWFGTVQVGCDYQAATPFPLPVVFGVFADYDFTSIKGDMSILGLGLGGQEKMRNAWSVGGRIGWLPFERLLAYVSGGYTQARFNEANLFLFEEPNLPLGLSVAKQQFNGWFVGGGYEYGLGWLPGVFWKTEYRFADYGHENVAIIDTATGVPTGLSIDSHKFVQTVRSELVWRFNFGGGPVVARY